MTRKDFELIAAAIKASKPVHDTQMDDSAVRLSAEMQFAATAASIATALAKTNSSFDRARFLAAAGVQS